MKSKCPENKSINCKLLDIKHTSLGHPQAFFRQIWSGLDVLARLYMIYIGKYSLECRDDVGSVERGSFNELHAVFRCQEKECQQTRLRLGFLWEAHRQMLPPLQL